MTRAVSDRDAVGDALVDSFRARGYAGASLRELGSATGLQAGSLYHRYPSGKPAMACAALDRTGASFAPLVLAPLAGGGDPAARLAASADGVRRFHADGALGCLLAVMALSDAPPEVLGRVRALFDAWLDALAAALAAAGAADARADAEDRVAAVQGALVFARASGDRRAFARAVARLGARP